MRIVCALLLYALCSSSTIAQNPVADFTASVVSGCSPLAVQFTDKSTGDPKFWGWDFGNGQLANVQNPYVVFSSPGVYTVKLVVRNANGVDGITKTNYITVNPSPTASFSSNTQTACAPADIQFTDRSVANAGTIVKWFWGFGDGGSSTQQSPVHQYSTVGFYDVFLTVTSSTGCSSSSGAGRYIRIVPGISPDFIFSGPTTCKQPFNMNFTNETSGPGNLSYNWNFGNGSSSTQVNPSQTFNTAGSYNITLTALSDYGCKASIQKAVPVNGATTSFNSPDTVCLNSPVSFQNTSSPASKSVLWNFGDSTQSTLANPTKTYTAPGTYAVTLRSDFGNCTDSVTKKILVSGPPKVDFTVPKATACRAPFNVTFQDLSPDATSWQWDFGDGGKANTKNPSHSYTDTGRYNVTLTITDSRGCQGSLTRVTYITVLSPTVAITNIPAEGCIPFTFKPTASVFAVDGVKSWAWDFGDGGTSTLANPAYTYTKENTYTVSVTITTNDGCTATASYPNGVKAGSPATVDFTKSATTGCLTSYINFTNTSSPAGSKWLWQFGDGGSSSQQNPAYKFTDTGYFNVTLTVFNNGCANSLTKKSYVHVSPPVANFTTTVDCNNRLSVAFTNKSKTDPAYGTVSYQWKFGDPGNRGATSQNANFTYPSYGTYTVRLITTNGSCVDTSTQTLSLFNEPAAFTPTSAAVCKNDSLVLNSTNTPSLTNKYAWSVDNGAPVYGTSRFAVSFPSNGNHTVTLTTTDTNRCVSTSPAANITVTGPTARFTTVNKGGCDHALIEFTDASTSLGKIVRWDWDFGDGTTQSFTAPHGPVFSHTYADTGTYVVKLRVTDNVGSGCSDTYSLSAGATITRPKANFGTANGVYCPGMPLQFTDSSSGRGLTYAWNFGDGGSSTLRNPSHVYKGADSVYSVKLVVHDSVGCADSLTRAGLVTIKSPKAAFSVRDTSTICPPLQTKFFLLAQNYTSWYWDFGDGSVSALQNPTHFYNAYGSFTAKLYVTGNGGCTDSASSVINLHNPYSETNITYDPPSPITRCNEVTVDFNVVTPSSTRFQFYFGDGTVDSSGRKSFQHYYGTPNFYGPTVLVADSTGCQAVVGGPSVIKVLGAIPVFGVDRKKFCDSGNVYFTNYTLANDSIVSSQWNFGDGATSNTKDAIHFYRQPGFYQPSLTVTTKAGCTKTFTDTIRVYGTPHPSINSAAPYCIGIPLQVDGVLTAPNTATTWKWDFGNGQSSSLQSNQVTYTKPGPYTIKLETTNPLGCKDTASKNIIISPVPAITISGDTSFIVGSGITIPLRYSAGTWRYRWSPPAHLSCTDCPNPYANPIFTTTYNVVVTDSNGCTAGRDITLISLCNHKNFFLPNTFSPNGDGVNDWFYPRGNGLDRIQAIRIFNRWGQLVFEKKNFMANDKSAGWDGSFKGQPAPMDTYVYMIDIICENAIIITHKGNVTLIR